MSHGLVPDFGGLRPAFRPDFGGLFVLCLVSGGVVEGCFPYIRWFRSGIGVRDVSMVR